MPSIVDIKTVLVKLCRKVTGVQVNRDTIYKQSALLHSGLFVHYCIIMLLDIVDLSYIVVSEFRITFSVS